MESKARALDEIERIAHRHVDLVELWRLATDAVARAVPHYWAPCWYSLDPESLLITSHFQEGIPALPREWLAQEYYDDDVNKLADIALSPTGISTLHEATGGDPSSSPRWHANMEYGGDQEMIAALRSRKGTVWGAVGLYREPGQPLFDDEDQRFLRTVSTVLADGVRRALLVGEATDPGRREPPGLVVLDEHFEVESSTAAARSWLDRLDGGDCAAGRLPAAVLSVAGATLRAGEVSPVARVRTTCGSWLTLHGAILEDGSTRRVTVVIEPAHPTSIAPLLMAVYGFTERERDVAGLVLKGESTTDIAVQLHLSAHTVQQHLVNIFDKTGVRSRRDLVGQVFFSYYEPRVRDNEQRAGRQAPLRGGFWSLRG